MNQQGGYPQPPPSYTPMTAQPPPPPPTVIVNVAPLGPHPTSVVCPSCHANIKTRVSVEASTRTHIIAAILCLFVCWPCVCLPYCMDSCQNANHYCPNCNAYLGAYAG